MRIDINDEFNRVAAQNTQSSVNSPSAAKNVSSNNLSVILENGVTDGYIENDKKISAEESNNSEDFENKQKQQQLCALANSMNEKELEQIKEDTDSIEDEDVDVLVTVHDKIIMKLEAFCDDFDSGMIEEFSDEELDAISSMGGNAALWARKLKEGNIPITEYNISNIQAALEMAGQINNISAEAKAYFLQNPDKSISIKSLYISSYSTSVNNTTSGNHKFYSTEAVGYVTQNSVGDDFSKVAGQVEEMLSKAGINVDEHVMENAKWLYDMQLPVNEENINRLEQLNKIEFPLTEEYLSDYITDAIKGGELPVDASIIGETVSSIIDKSKNAADVINNTVDDDIKAAIAAFGEDFTVGDLKDVKSGNVSSAAEQISDEDIVYVTVRRQVEEIRLQMTVESFAIMEKNGIDIDTSSLTQLIENLKKIEANYSAMQLTGASVDASEENIALLAEINNTVANIGNYHAGLISVVAFESEEMLLSEIDSRGASFSEKYKKAESAYETVMTKPRADMGDSIKKAFRNVDDILDEMNIEKTSDNQRAVRILGYNNIEITEENIDKVKSVDSSVNRMISHMNPSTVIKMIRDNFNPLNHSVDEINERIDMYQEDSNVSQEKYSEFLWKMEQHKEITDSEREAYIGIYRLLNQIDKSDGALVGALVAQGAGITMENLLSASRTRKHSAMDVKVDDDFSGYDSKLDKSISEQIEKGFSPDKQKFYANLAAKTLENISADGIEQALSNNDLGNMSFEQFAEAVQNMAENSDIENEYLKYQLENFREIAQNADKQILNLLSSFDLPASINNIEAVHMMLNQSGGWMKKLFFDENTRNDELIEKAEQLFENMGVSDNFETEYEEFVQDAKSFVERQTDEEADTYIDVKTNKLITSCLNITVSMAREELYQVPVEIDGEFTAINLKFRLNTNEQQKVSISMNTTKFGVVNAEFTISSGKVRGLVIASDSEGCTVLKDANELLEESVSSNTGLTISDISYVNNKESSSNDIFNTKDDSQNKKASSKELYQFAKAFIETVKSVIEFAG